MGSSMLSALVDYTLFMIFLSIIGQKLIILCNVLARIISATFNYFVNKRLVFKSHGNTLKSLLKYAILAACILIANSLILYVLTNLLSIAAWLSKIIVEILLFSISYIIQKRFIFNK